MAEQFDPNISIRPGGTDATTLVTEMDPPAGLSRALDSTRQAFSGLEDLPVEEPVLEGQEVEVAPTTEPEPPATAVTLPLEPAGTAPAPMTQQAADVAAMQARLAYLETELLRSRQAPADVTPTLPQPVTIGDDVVNRITDRFRQNFASIQEQRADESESDFETRRARSFAETIVASVYEDLLPTEAVQARFQPTVERVATSVAQNAVRSQTEAQSLQQQQDTLLQQAVAAAKQAGYDVYLPGTPQHAQSRESRLFWGAATQIDPALPGDAQIREALALMPPKAAPAAPPPQSPSRPQPMGRQGAVPAAVAPGATGQEYAPLSMRDMLNHAQQVRTFGGGV